MRKFTKCLLTLALLVLAVGGAKAEKLYADLSKLSNGPVSTWDATTNTITWTAQSNNMISNFDFAAGDYSSWEKVVVKVTSIDNCIGVRIQIKANGKEKTKPFNGTGTIEVALSDYDFAAGDLASVEWIRMLGSGYYDGESHTINADNPASAVIAEVYLERPDDPLAIPKDNLTNAIALGNAQSSFAKTTASWNALQTAISDGETEYANPSATVESLNAATQAINDAIAGFEYQPGYTKLTKEMANANVDYTLNKSTGLPYGHGGVLMNVYADLSAYDKLIVVASAGLPRFCMNRQTSDGQIGATKAESNMIDINPQGQYASCTWATDAYLTVDEKVYTVDLKKISDDWNGEVKLHCIKGGNYSNVTVTDMLLYRTPKSATIGSAGYATFSADKAVKIQGVTAYAAKLNGNTVTLTPVTEVPANNAVILEGAADTYNFTVLDNAAAIANNDLLVSDGNASGSNIYVLADGANGVGFYKLASSDKVPAGKGYLTIGSGAAPEFLGFGGDATGINEVKAVEAKGEFFNLAGQRVAKPAKGLYIANGKKVIIK